MQDTALYQYLLGLKSPWTVSRVQLNITGQCIDVWAEHPTDAGWACPHCTKTLPLYDHAEERTWRHLDSCQFHTHLHARIPRVGRREHGVVQVTVPWAEPRSRFTLLFERLAIDVLGQCNVIGATRILRLSWDEAWGIMERAPSRGGVTHPKLSAEAAEEGAGVRLPNAYTICSSEKFDRFIGPLPSCETTEAVSVL